ncbi:hypothetical protein [Pelobacter propionicus]|uniref:Uncharacterized protein n=1 Tax=Pelobacter propionicus (strain DSM 2379 / NBRC 103807 / OttBd1) TaxID=338966 RepID=A1AKN2_PELPD|nr:hypothetical protein [Pelobacter propionicus]ABK97902.1 conserved hypothetical protein [Pelobacter propionicus DSM 2379]
MRIENLEEKLNSRIVEAYISGLSVIEITRVLNKSSAEHIHNLLRDTGHIDTLKKEGLRRSYGIDDKWETALRKKGYSFPRWCAGWGFDPVKSAQELALGERGDVHEALKRDFPIVYSRMFGEVPPHRKPTIRIHDPHPSVTIMWHPDRNAYVAEMIGDPTINAAGIDLEHALQRFLASIRYDEHIKRLDLIIAQKQSS